MKAMNANWVNEIEQPQNPKIHKTIWGLFSVAFLAVLFFAWLIFFNLNTIQTHHNRFLGGTLSDVSAAASILVIQQDNMQLLQQMADNLAQNPYVLDAVFYDNQGLVLAQSTDAKLIVEYSLSLNPDSDSPYRWYVTPIETATEKLGYIRLTVDENLFEQPDTQSQTLIAYAMLSMLLIVAAISYYVAYYLHVERFAQPKQSQQTLIAENESLTPENLRNYLNCFSVTGNNALVIIEWTNHSQNSPLHQVLLRAAKLYKGEYIALNQNYSIVHFTAIHSQHASQRTVQYLRLIKKLFEKALPSRAHFRAGAHQSSEAAEVIFQKADALCRAAPSDHICISENMYQNIADHSVRWRSNRNSLLEVSWILDNLDTMQERLLDRQVDFLLQS